MSKKSGRRDKFLQRESYILQMAEHLLLDSYDYDLTLDELARYLELSKGTLYKHFISKDELFMRLLIAHEQQMLNVNTITDDAGIVRMILGLIAYPRRTALYHVLESRLESTSLSVSKSFEQLYQIRQQRMTAIRDIAQKYLQSQDSTLQTEAYLSLVWALGFGGAELLNSSFYQRYVGGRDELGWTLLHQVLNLPKLYAVMPDKPEPVKESIISPPKLIKPLMPPSV